MRTAVLSPICNSHVTPTLARRPEWSVQQMVEIFDEAEQSAVSSMPKVLICTLPDLVYREVCTTGRPVYSYDFGVKCTIFRYFYDCTPAWSKLRFFSGKIYDFFFLEGGSFFVLTPLG